MKDKGLVIGAIAVLAIVIIGILIVSKPKSPKPNVQGVTAPAAKPAAAVKKAGRAIRPTPAKKPITKDMGAITVKVLSSKGKPVFLRVRAFMSIDSRSSVLAGVFTTGRTQELLPGTYDIEVGTIPAKIYKGIKVVKDRETIEDLGRLTGTLEVKTTSSSKKTPAYQVRALYAKSKVLAAAGSVNRPMEIASGVYDVEIASIPMQVRKDVRIDAGKEVLIDIGATGTLTIKMVNGSGREVRGTARIKKAENAELVGSRAFNRPFEVFPGMYIVETTSRPPQTKSDVKIIAGEETVVDFVVQAPLSPAARPILPRPTVPAKPAAAPDEKPGV